MGMLMHHTWLEQQKQKPVAKPVKKPVEETNEPEAEPVKKATGRRKVIK